MSKPFDFAKIQHLNAVVKSFTQKNYQKCNFIFICDKNTSGTGYR